MDSLTLQTTLNQVVSLSHHVMAPCAGMRCEASVTFLNGNVHVLLSDLMDLAHYMYLSKDITTVTVSIVPH